MNSYLHRMTVGEILSNSIKLYASNFGLFSIICVMPALILTILAYGLDGIPVPWLLRFFIGLTLGLMTGIISQAATTIAVSDICLHNRPALAHCLRSIGSRIGGLLAASVLTSIIVAIASLLLVIPAFAASVFLVFTAPIIVLERRSAYRAMLRSIQLTRGCFWRNAGILAILLCVLFAATLIIGIILGLVSAISNEMSQLMFRLLINPALSFVTPILTITIALLYYEMRVRKENYDADGLVQDLAA